MSTRVWLEDSGAAEILRYNPKLESMERDYMGKKIDEVRAEFQNTFGFQGKFELQAVQTRPGKAHGRLTFRIRADDARTQATLKRNPGWLAKFIE